MENLNELNLKELSQKELCNCSGGFWGIIALAVTSLSFAYTLGKDSYAIHPESFV